MARKTTSEPLTARERQIAEAYSNGSSFRQIAAQLFIAPTTVRTHLSAIYRKLGVSSKIELLRALASADGNAQQESSAADTPPTARVDRATDETVEGLSASRRQERRVVVLLVVNVDIARPDGRTTDIELIRDYISRFSSRAGAEIARVEGSVVHQVGERLVACLGWPIAHEDDPARATRAALAIREAVQQLRASGDGIVPHCRAVVATGTVIAERSENRKGKQDIFLGDALGVIDRILAAARPDQILVNAAVADRVVSAFATHALDTRVEMPNGTSEAVFSVDKELPAASRFDSRTGARLLRMIGRDEELAFLEKRWATAKSGEGQAVMVTGEAGIGKSRLIREIVEEIDSEPVRLIHYQCWQNYRDSAFSPITARLLADSEIASGDSSDQKRAKLQRVLESAGVEGLEAMPLIAALVGIENTDESAMLANLPPKVRRARTMDALTRYAIGLSGSSPLLVVFEDIHWADPSTYEWMVQLIEATSKHPVLILLSSRPEQFPQLSGLLNLTQLSLNRLNREGGIALVEEIAGPREVTERVRNAIVERGDGIPLFIEELTKSVLEIRMEPDASDQPRDQADVLKSVIPATLQELILARIDRLDIDKEILQVAACIGRQFSHALLSATVDTSQAILLSTLQQLIASGMVFVRGTPPESQYIFKHALIRDAVYVGLVRRERERIHKNIAMALDSVYRQTSTLQGRDLDQYVPVENDPGQIAHHYMEAKTWDKALEFFLLKGRNAYAEYANLEAVDALSSALSALDNMGDSFDNVQKRVEISILLGSIYTFVGELGRGLEHYSSASKKAEDLKDKRLLIHSFAKIGRAYYDIGEYERCDKSYSEALELAKAERDQARIASIYNGLGLLRLTVSTLPEAIRLFEKSLESQSRLGNRSGEASACISLALAWNRVGDARKAEFYAQRSLDYSHETDDKRQRLWSLIALANTKANLGDEGSFGHLLEMAEAEFHDISHYQATTWLVWIRALIAIDSVDVENGFDIAEKGVEIVRDGGFFAHETAATFARSAALYFITGHSDLAWEAARKAIDWARHGPIRLELGIASIVLMQLHATRGSRDDEDVARNHFMEAVQSFEAVGAELDLGRAYLAGAETLHAWNVSEARIHAKRARDIFTQYDAKILLSRAERLVAVLQ